MKILHSWFGGSLLAMQKFLGSISRVKDLQELQADMQLERHQPLAHASYLTPMTKALGFFSRYILGRYLFIYFPIITLRYNFEIPNILVTSDVTVFSCQPSSR